MRLHLYERKHRKQHKEKPGVLIVSVLFLLLLFFGVNWILNMAHNEEADLLYQAINKAVVNYYAIEGRYPENLQEVVDTYGIVINEDKYIVTYDIFASNVKPDVEVIVKGETAE
jgi:hypothetical protein